MKRASLAALLIGSLALGALALPAANAGPLVDVSVTDLTDAHVLPTYLDRGQTYIPGATTPASAYWRWFRSMASMP